MAEERVSVVIKGRDMASSVLKRVTNSWKEMVVVWNQGLALLGKIFRAGRRVAEGLVNMINRGGQYVNVMKAFNRVSGEGTAALAKLREATGGLISNYELMVGFNRAVTLGAAKTTEQFGELAETAITLGRALGVDAAFALESLTLGIGRQSKLILDNLGLIVSVASANKRYAEVMGIVNRSLTDNEKREAFRSAAMASARQKIVELGGVTRNAADEMVTLGTSFKNAFDQISAAIVGSQAIQDFLKGLNGLVGDIVSVISGGSQIIGDAFGMLGRIAADTFASKFLHGLINLITTVGQMPLVGVLFDPDGDDFTDPYGLVSRVNQIDDEIKLRAALLQTLVMHARNNAPVGGGAPGSVGGGVGAPALAVGGPFGPADSGVLGLRRVAPELEETYLDVTEATGTMAQTVADEFTFMTSSMMADSSRATTAIIHMFARIAAQQVGGPLGTIIGGVGGIIGGLFGKRREPTPVRISEVDERAAKQLERHRGPTNVTVHIVDQFGRDVRDIQYQLNRQQARDAQERLPGGHLG